MKANLGGHIFCALLLASCAAGHTAATVAPADRQVFKDEIGARRWVITAPLCSAPDIAVPCPASFKGYFQIQDVVVNGASIYYVVAADDGRQGYIPFEYRPMFMAEDPAITAQKKIEACKKLGQPRIGMSAKQVEATCWGKPDHVNRSETAGVIFDQYVYGEDRFVYLRNGVVTSIQTSGTLR